MIYPLKAIRLLILALFVLNVVSGESIIPVGTTQKSASKQSIDWPEFLARQDMVWDQVPTDWLQAPYLGNGMLGLMLFQEGASRKNAAATNEKNVLSLHVGRGDYYDNRPPNNGDHTWIYRGRLPIGFFRIRSKGDVTGADWRLDLWNAKLVGTVTTTVGSYQIESFVHSRHDSFYFKVTPQGEEVVTYEWQPQEAYSYPRLVCERNAERAKAAGKPVEGINKSFTAMPYPKAPAAEVVNEPTWSYCRQVLYADSGELVTAWKVEEDSGDRSSTLYGTIAFSQKMGEALPKAQSDLVRAVQVAASGQYLSSHVQWWHDYYPQSFVSLSDDFWEQFYWIQMYKFASATRANGMMVDVMGPWYQPGFWPMIWTDLNVQLIYWTHLTANRLDVGASLMNQMDRYAENLVKNVPKDWQHDSLNAGTIFPADMIAPVGKSVPDHIVWMLHDYWLHCVYADDQERMRDGLFPLLKKAVNTYLNYLTENPLDLGDGKIHIKHSWSPEYPGGRGVDINYTIALIRWSCRTLLDIDRVHGLNDPKAKDWQHLLDNLVDYQIDETGLRVGRDIPFDKGHRHYSHLLGYYPMYDLNPDKDLGMLKKSVDHWLATVKGTDQKTFKAMPMTGYTCTGAASMYAGFGDGNTALEYLRILPFKNVSSTTMYAEGNPVIESPFSAATSIHDMLLQSWGGRIRVMPAVPDEWEDAYFQDLLCQGGALVSADRQGGKLIRLQIDSPNRARDLVFTMAMEQPSFQILDGNGGVQRATVLADSEGFYRVSVPAGGSIKAIAHGSGSVATVPVKSSADNANIFGYNVRFDAVIKGFEKVRKALERAQRVQQADIELDRGLIGHWSFDEDFQDAKSVAGKIKQGGQLDGRTAIDLGNAPKYNLQSSLSLSAWIHPERFNDYPAVVGKGYEIDGSYSLHIRAEGNLWFEIEDVNGVRVVHQPRDQLLKPGEWAHVAATYDGERMQVFINGDAVGEAKRAPGLTIKRSDSPLRIGWLGKYGYFKGVIDDVRLYDRALSPDEILVLSIAGSDSVFSKK